MQSVALRLVAEREAEIGIFEPQEYWSIQVELLVDEKVCTQQLLAGVVHAHWESGRFGPGI